MKRTTYIILGMLLAGVVAMGGFIIYIYNHGTVIDENTFNIAGTQKSVALPHCKAIKLVMAETLDLSNKTDNSESRIKRWVTFNDVPLIVSPSDSSSGHFTYISGLDRYMVMHAVGDTLVIALNFDSAKQDETEQSSYWMNIHAGQMSLTLPPRVQLLTATLPDQKVTLRGFKQDSLSIVTNSEGFVEQSHFGALTIKGNKWSLNSGAVNNLHLSLDGMEDWSVNTDSFRIDTEYLSGAGDRLEATLQKGECRRAVWQPQSENASLKLKLKEAAEIKVLGRH